MAKVGVTQEIIGDVSNIYPLRNGDDDNKISVIDFKVKSTHRFLDRDADEWKDGDTIWSDCTAFGQVAENIAESFRKWDRVLVKGAVRLKKAYTKENGEEVPARPYVNVEFASLEISRHPAHSDKPEVGGGGGSSSSGGSKSSGATHSKSAKSAPKKESKPATDDFDLDLDDDDDIDF